ncbi:hypothetical protein BKA69DRAFT_292044 [Paraphysoderma sedebokerense]|nr:hypothetical protein BKA69DRAFT_292044 [Paraphysoderma sedebokerense]
MKFNMSPPYSRQKLHDYFNEWLKEKNVKFEIKKLDPFIMEIDGDEFQSRLKSTSDRAKTVDVACQYFSQKNVTIPENCQLSPTKSTPVEIINNLTQTINGAVEWVEDESTDGGHIISAKWDVGSGSQIEVPPYGPYKDKSYAKNKVAMKLLQHASFRDQRIWEAYRGISKIMFREGQIADMHEGVDVELKGCKENIRITSTKAKTLLKDHFEGLAAMLNTQGGSLYLGIHGKTNHVQGVLLSIQDVDEINLLFSNLWKTLVPALPLEFPPKFHAVIPYSETPPAEGHKLYIVEFHVPRSPTLVSYKNIAYSRNGASTHPIPFDILQQKIVEQFLSSSLERVTQKRT